VDNEILPAGKESLFLSKERLGGRVTSRLSSPVKRECQAGVGQQATGRQASIRRRQCRGTLDGEATCSRQLIHNTGGH
jgi:hypothetical protein